MYTVHELAERFGLSAQTIYNLTYQGVLPPATGFDPNGRNYSQRHFDLLVTYRKQIPHRDKRVTQADLAERLRRTGRLDLPNEYRP